MHRKDYDFESYDSGNLTDTNENPGYLDVKLHHQPNEKEEGEPTLLIRIPADGNCGFYAIALGLIDLITQNKLALLDDNYKVLLALMRDPEQKGVVSRRLAYYKDGKPFLHNHADDAEKRVWINQAAPYLEKLQKDLEQNKFSDFKKFKNYLLQENDYFQVLAMIIFLAPTLRKLSINLSKGLYKELCKLDGYPILDPPAMQDGASAEFNQLNLLSEFFQFHLHAYDVNNTAIQGSYGDLPKQAGPAAEVKNNAQPVPEISELDTRPIIAIRYNERAKHWDYLLPQSAYVSPPFLFGFSYNDVKFTQELEEEEEANPEQAAKMPMPSVATPEKENTVVAAAKEQRKFGHTKPVKTTALWQLQVDLAYQKKQLRDFQEHLTKLKKAVENLSEDKRKIGDTLVNILENNLNSLFPPLHVKKNQFKQEQQNAFIFCHQAVTKVHKEFRQEAPSILNVLANLALFLISGGIGYLIVGSIHYRATGRFGFFNKPALSHELPAFSKELLKLKSKSGESLDLTETPKMPPEETEALMPLQPFKEWSKIRF